MSFECLYVSQQDYIFINKKWVNSILICEAYFFFEGVSSNHRLVTARIHLRLCRNKKLRVKTTCYVCSSLTNTDKGNKYTITVRNKFDLLQEISETYSTNDEYENFINSYMEATTECMIIKSRAKCRVHWESLEVKKKMRWHENSILTE